MASGRFSPIWLGPLVKVGHLFTTGPPVDAPACIGEALPVPTIVDAHHKVLLSWAQFRASLPRAPRLLTLDHHTDTSKPFRNFLRQTYGTDGGTHEDRRADWLSAIDFTKPATVTAAVEKLSNDEHIVTAIQCDIIAAAFVVAHNAMDTDLTTYQVHKIMCRSVGKDSTRYQATRGECDQVIESAFLQPHLDAFDESLALAGEPPLLHSPYILDIDLDYFNTSASVAPKDATLLRTLAQGAGLVTIATEPEHVKACALDPSLSSSDLLAKLLNVLSAP